MSNLSPIGGTFLSRFHILYVRFQLGNGIICPISVALKRICLDGIPCTEVLWFVAQSQALFLMSLGVKIADGGNL